MLAIIVFISHTASAQSGWVLLNNPATVGLTAVDFTHGNSGIVTGDSRTILRTTDGGTTWTAAVVAPGEAMLEDVSFANDSIGLATGLDGQILTTVNGGANWTVVQEGWMIQYHAAHMISPTVGFVMGMNTIMQSFGSKTSNHWQTHSDFNFYVNQDGTGYEGAVRDCHFFNATTGCAAVRIWDGQGAIVKTTDGGQSWSTNFWSSRTVWAIDFPTPTVGYACGESGLIAKTTDGGDSWEQFTTNIPYTFYDLKCLNADTGWAVGEAGVIYRTNDGALTAHQQESGVASTLRSVDFVNPDTGYVVGDDGVILKTTTGGEIVNQPPAAFRRIVPVDDSGCLRTMTTFRWSTAVDPDGDPVLYEFHYSFEDVVQDSVVTPDTTLPVDLTAPQFPWGAVDVHWWVLACDAVNPCTGAENGVGHLRAYSEIPVDPRGDLQPADFTLSAFPNPFNPATTISFTLPHAANVLLTVFDVQGRLVREDRLSNQTAGSHRISFDGSDLPSGIYLARLSAGSVQKSTKLLLVK
jgi:photosystem II stability/assembly factor-like uncharacterized protein